MKNKLLKAFFATTIITLVSCNTEFTETGMIENDNRPTVSLVNKSMTIIEGTSDMIKFKVDKATKNDIHLLISLEGAESDNDNHQILPYLSLGDNYATGSVGGRGFQLTIPAYTTEAEFEVTSLIDGLSGDQSYTLLIKDDKYHNGKMEGGIAMFQVNVLDKSGIIFNIDQSGKDPNGFDMCNINSYLGVLKAPNYSGFNDWTTETDCTINSRYFTGVGESLENGERYNLIWWVQNYNGYGGNFKEAALPLTLEINTGGKVAFLDLSTIIKSNSPAGPDHHLGHVEVSNTGEISVFDVNGDPVSLN